MEQGKKNATMCSVAIGKRETVNAPPRERWGTAQVPGKKKTKGRKAMLDSRATVGRGYSA